MTRDTSDKSTTGTGSATRHPPLATLHQLFDGLPVEAADARHARDCPSCAHQLQALLDQRAALGHLLHREADWVAAANRQGRAVLTDLLAELARACLGRREVAGAAAPRSAPLSELPRPVERITADIRTLVTRLTGLAKSAKGGAAAARPAPWSGLERLAQRREDDPALPTAALDALRALEGPTPRWRALAGAGPQP